MPGKANAPGNQRAGSTAPEAKKSRKISQADSEKKGTVSFEVYHSEASTFQSIGEHKKAINSYTKALELKNGDKNCLIARAQCYLRLGDAAKALADANETLKEDQKYIKGILIKAESYYLMMQFEYALMFYHRGNKLRPEVQAFRLGIQKSQEAIDNCIGDDAGIKLENKGDLTAFYEGQEQQKQKQKRGTGGYQKPAVKSEDKREQRQVRSACKDSKTCKQLLGQLFADKEYLEKLLKETESASHQSETNNAIRSLAINGLDYLDTRTEFWHQQQPLYSRNRDTRLRGENNAREIEDADRNKNPTQWLLKQLETIDEAQADGRHEESLKKARKALAQAEKWSDKDVHNRMELIANLHSCMGNAFLETGNYALALENHNRDYDLAVEHDIDDAKSRSLDNLGRVHARMGKFEKAIDVWEKKVPMTKSPLESTWLYHEIGRCHLELGDNGKAKEFGELSLKAAEEAEDDLWQLNSSVLMAQADVKLGELETALQTFEKAHQMATSQGDKAAESAIQRAIDDINHTIEKRSKTDENDETKSNQSPRGKTGENTDDTKREEDEKEQKEPDKK